MHRIATLCAALLLIACVSARAGEIQGSWTATLLSERPGEIDLSLTTDRHDQHGSPIDRADLRGLSSSDIESSRRVPVRFTLEREAGTFPRRDRRATPSDME